MLKVLRIIINLLRMILKQHKLHRLSRIKIKDRDKHFSDSFTFLYISLHFQVYLNCKHKFYKYKQPLHERVRLIIKLSIET
jgi:hypothetical protein